MPVAVSVVARGGAWAYRCTSVRVRGGLVRRAYHSTHSDTHTHTHHPCSQSETERRLDPCPERIPAGWTLASGW